MKKIDLHMHTVPTISDAHFTFSLEKLSEYVKSAELDAVAVTNHDLFDLQQFNEIVEKLECVVFPGIEINLDKGHVLIISENKTWMIFNLELRLYQRRLRLSGIQSPLKIWSIYLVI